MYSITLFGYFWKYCQQGRNLSSHCLCNQLNALILLPYAPLTSFLLLTSSLQFSLICFVCFRITMYYLLGLPENAFFYFVVFHFILLSLNLGFIFVIFMYLAFNFIKHRGDKRALEWMNLAIWRKNLPWLILKRTCSRNKFTLSVFKTNKCFV